MNYQIKSPRDASNVYVPNNVCVPSTSISDLITYKRNSQKKLKFKRNLKLTPPCSTTF